MISSTGSPDPASSQYSRTPSRSAKGITAGYEPAGRNAPGPIGYAVSTNGRQAREESVMTQREAAEEPAPQAAAAGEPGPGREKTFLLAAVEARVLERIARRLPARALPDHLTALGVAAALGIA